MNRSITRTALLGLSLTSASQVREKGKVAAADGLRSGQAGTVSVTLKPGTYQLFCNIPGHYKGGMHNVITVK